MSTFNVIITTTPPASVSITGANTTYTQFRNSLGSYVYLVEKIYLYDVNGNQVNQIMLFTKYDANGTKSFINLTPIIDPYQDSNAFILNTKEDNIVLDGRGSLNFTLLAGASLIFRIIAERVAITDYLDGLSENNYQQLEAAMGKVGLFDNFKDEI